MDSYPIEIQAYPDSEAAKKSYEIWDLYLCLKRIEEIAGYINFALLNFQADDMYWTIWRMDDHGHFTEDFLKTIKANIQFDEIRELTQYLLEVIRRKYSYKSSLQEDLESILIN